MPRPCRYEMLEIDSVKLDTTNPRIRQYIEMYGESPSAEELHLALNVGSSESEASSSTTFNSLKESIRTNQGLINPIIVNRITGGDMVVVEGNTRVAIYRGFRSEGAEGPWETIPAMVYQDLQQNEIDAIRLQAHLVGPRPWDAYSKAKYLHHLRNVEQMPFNQLVDYCGGKKRELTIYLDAYADMEKYYRPVADSDSDFDPSRFSSFAELQRPAVKRAVLQAGHTLTDFATWVHERLIDPQENVRALPLILANPTAHRVFLQDGSKAASKLLETPPSATSQTLSFEDLLRAVTQRINQMPFGDLVRMQKNPSISLSVALMEAEEALIDVCGRIRDYEG